MSIQQWDQHAGHFDQHVGWPATKQQIYEACKGEDVEKSVLDEIQAKLSDGGKKYTEKEVKDLLVS